MEKLSKEISLLITDSETKRLKGYIRADQIRETIANYQADIQILRENLVVYCTISTRVQLFEIGKKVTNLSQERNIALDEDFSELQEFRQVFQSDIYLKEEVVSVEPYEYTGSLLFKEYHGTISFNGKEYSTTTRSFEPGESGQERLKAELKLLAHIRHPNITQVAAVCFSRSFPSIVYYDDLRPVDWSSERARIRYGPYTISHLTGLYRQMRAQRGALVHIIDKLPSFFIGSPRDAPDNPDIGFLWWSIVGWESPSTKGILRVYIAGDGRPLLSLAPPRTNSSQQDMEEGSIGAVVYAYSDNYISENTLQQIECQGQERLDPSKEVITSSLHALFHIILYTRDYGDSRAEPHRAEPPYLGAIYYQCACRWELTPIGRKPQAVGIFPLKSHHCQCGNWTTGTDPEPAEWQARARTARRIWLKFDLSYWPDNTGSFHISCMQRLTQSKTLELLHASMAQLCHIKGILENSFQGKCNSCNSQSLSLVKKLEWMVKVWKPVKRLSPPSVSELYLFIEDPVIPYFQGAGPNVPEVYWSKCPDGTTRVTTLELYALGIERAPVVWCKYEFVKLNLNLVDILQGFYQSCGLNPFSHEVSNLLELPLPQHIKLGVNQTEPKQLKRRHSFSAYRQKPSRRDKALQINEIDFGTVYYHLKYGGRMSSLISRVSRYLSEEYEFLQEFNQRLGMKVAKYWAFMAAPELLPESLKLYNLRTTGHDFEYGETGIDPANGYTADNPNEALQGVEVVLIPAGVPRKPSMTRDDLFNTNASIVYDLAAAIARNVPNAHILVISNPVNSTVPIVARTLEKAGTYDPTRLFGITTLDVVRASRFLPGIAGTDPAQTPVTVVGGHSGVTIVPLLSQSSAGAAYGGDEVVQTKDGAGSATLSMAYAAAKFTNLLLRVLKGEAGIVTPTFVKSPLFAAQGIDFSIAVELGYNGVAKIHDLGNITQEQELVNAALPELKKNIEKGFAFVQ
ncbi:hypothetical protein M422DRAFT_271124 [Sphaerobolus stellatus SS14]|uniref:malate dehydrogenase n=1 Tax=Sphaerobolus stellatus (strain SS14) TaxID=990650 RepID=A0A0C9TEH1_SPHS4|nr:hypothetical protein M422DRAFT_271124 [Sphaerobolus stellatus SS14]